MTTNCILFWLFVSKFSEFSPSLDLNPITKISNDSVVVYWNASRDAIVYSYCSQQRRHLTPPLWIEFFEDKNSMETLAVNFKCPWSCESSINFSPLKKLEPWHYFEPVRTFNIKNSVYKKIISKATISANWPLIYTVRVKSTEKNNAVPTLKSTLSIESEAFTTFTFFSLVKCEELQKSQKILYVCKKSKSYQFIFDILIFVLYIRIYRNCAQFRCVKVKYCVNIYEWLFWQKRRKWERMKNTANMIEQLILLILLLFSFYLWLTHTTAYNKSQIYENKTLTPQNRESGKLHKY